MIAITISPPIIAIAHPSRAWSRTLSVRVRGIAGANQVIITPEIGSGSHLLPTRLPAWIHIPRQATLHDGQAGITIHGQAPRHTSLNLALEIAPMFGAASGVRVVGAPLAGLWLGQPGVAHASLSITAPPIRLTRGDQLITVSERDTGRSWIMPSASVDGRSLISAMPLMPGQSTAWQIKIPIDQWGSNPITASAPAAAPITSHTWVLPGWPIAAAAAGIGLLAGAYALGERRQSPQKNLKQRSDPHDDPS